MKRTIERFLTKIIKNNFFWSLLKPLATAGVVMHWAREKFELRSVRAPKITKELFASLVVLNGPFKGMKYQSAEAAGSTVFCKLLGSYEFELEDIVNELLNTNYSEILNVGSAEGYYAVGCAMHCENATVYAYDILSESRDRCEELARINGVSERIKIGTKFTPEELGEFQFSGRGLILSDCEGFEKELFRESNLSNLSNCDILIETHDFIDLEISSYLKDLLGETHEVRTILSTDDVQKAIYYDFPEVASCSLEERKQIFAEGRQSIMEWLYCKPKV